MKKLAVYFEGGRTLVPQPCVSAVRMNRGGSSRESSVSELTACLTKALSGDKVVDPCLMRKN